MKESIGVVGLGRMGSALVERLCKASHIVYAFDKNEHARAKVVEYGALSVASIAELVDAVTTVWLMVPVGAPVDMVLDSLLSSTNKNLVIIDGGNSHFADSIRRSERLMALGHSFLDCGTSGGLKGRELGFSLMIGGAKEVYQKVVPFFEAIAAPQGYAHVGPSGAGHYVKMVHNGIEYALLQAYAEGFHLLKDGRYKELDLAQITQVWQHGSVIRSWLLDLSHELFVHDQKLNDVEGSVEEGGTGRWTVEEAHVCKIPVDLIERSLQIRKESRLTGGSYATKVVAMLRNLFGGHTVKKR